MRLSLPSATALAARVIPSILLGIGKSLLREEPIKRAIKRLEGEYPIMRGPLGDTVRAWISDEAVTKAVKEVQIGGAKVEVTGDIIDAFIRHSAIEGLTRDAAERFIASFWQILAQEAGKEEIGPWRQENIVRHEAVQTREALKGDLVRISTQVSELRAHVLAAALASSEGGDEQPWHKRIDEANRLFKGGRVRSALTAYEQILGDVDGQPVGPRVRYRLYANIGACLIALDRWNDAEDQFRRALDAAPGDALALAQLGQIELHKGRRHEARELARQAIEADGQSLIGWLVKMQAEEEADFDSIPPTIQAAPECWVARAKKAFSAGLLDQVEHFSREALRRSDRTPHQLIEIAEMLHVAHAVRPHTEVPEAVRTDVIRLTSEALDNLPEDELPKLAAYARTLRGIARLPDAPEVAIDDLRRAIELDPSTPAVRAALAHALFAAEDYGGAFHVLRDISDDARTHALRARVLLQLDRPRRDVETELLSAFDLLGSGVERQGLLLDLADTATRAGLPSIAERFLDEVQEEQAPVALSVLRARVAAIRGEVDEAERQYCAALEAEGASPEDVRDARIELAGFLVSEGRHGAAADAFRDADALNGSDWIRSGYARALIGASRWGDLQALLERVRSEGELPDWGLDAASLLALRRDDLASARAYLEEMITREIATPAASIRLAHALLRMGEVGEAAGILDKLSKEALEAEDEARIAQLYYHAGRPDTAIRTAYRAWRKEPTVPELAALLVTMVFQAPEGIPAKRDPEEVGPETWVRLEAVDGSGEAAYFLTSDEPIPGRREEIRADSPEAERLKGARLNDTRILRPVDLDPVEYRVREIRTVYVRAAQEAAAHLRTHIGDEPLPLQAVRTGSPDSVRFLAPIISVLYRSEAATRRATEFYHERRVPLACVAQLDNVPLRRAYVRMTVGPDGPLRVEAGAPGSMHAAAIAAEGAREVVVSLTALLTLQRLNLLELLPAVYESVLVPPSAVDALRQERRDFQDEIDRGSIQRMGPGPRGIEVTEVSVDAVHAELRELDALITFVSDSTEAVARPVERLGDDEERLREVLGDAETDAVLAASPDRALFADDQGLRMLAGGQSGAPTFSTYAFLEAAEKRGHLPPDQRWKAVLQLVQLNHAYVPVSRQLLMTALRADGLAFGARLRAVLDRLVGPETNLATALPVAAGFVREVANEPLAGGGFRGVVWAILNAFSGAPKAEEVLARLDRTIASALALAPVAHSRYVREREAFKRVKGVDF